MCVVGCQGNAQFPYEFQTTFIDAHNELFQGSMVMRKTIKDTMIDGKNTFLVVKLGFGCILILALTIFMTWARYLTSGFWMH